MTTKQKQHLLAYLGYYTGAIDGGYGPQTQAATEAFQRDYSLTVDGKFGTDTEKRIREVIATGEAPQQEEDAAGDSWWADIKHFTREEFRCHCGGKYCNGFPAEPQEQLIRVADRVRAYFGGAATVSSGVRCPTHNANVGGVSNSRHLSGKAMDFCVKGFSADMVLAYVRQQKDIRYCYAIDEWFVHMDIK